MEPTEPKNNLNLENNKQETTSEKNPYSGIFFEVDILMEKAKAACIERLQPLAVREPEADEVFACIEVFNYQDFGLNYNRFSKEGNEMRVRTSSLGIYLQSLDFSNILNLIWMEKQHHRSKIQYSMKK